MMKAFQVFKADHGDFVRDVAYDYYGKRIATCSSDGSVKVWDQTAHGEWQCVSTLPRSNAGAINRVGWAHPEFGQVIVTCSGGRGVAIYEEHRTSSWLYCLSASLCPTITHSHISLFCLHRRHD
jgi:WD40 repeat protein